MPQLSILKVKEFCICWTGYKTDVNFYIINVNVKVKFKITERQQVMVFNNLINNILIMEKYVQYHRAGELPQLNVQRNVTNFSGWLLEKLPFPLCNTTQITYRDKANLYFKNSQFTWEILDKPLRFRSDQISFEDLCEVLQFYFQELFENRLTLLLMMALISKCSLL